MDAWERMLKDFFTYLCGHHPQFQRSGRMSSMGKRLSLELKAVTINKN